MDRDLLYGYDVERYVSLNESYRKDHMTPSELFDVGEFVDFDDNYINGDYNADGYSVRVDKVQIIDYSTFLRVSNQNEFLKRKTIAPEKMALIHITIRKDIGTGTGVRITDFGLHGIDVNLPMDWETLILINPILGGDTWVTLTQDTECNLVLPYALYKSKLPAVWDLIEKYPLFLRITSFPVEKEVQLMSMREY